MCRVPNIGRHFCLHSACVFIVSRTTRPATDCIFHRPTVLGLAVPQTKYCRAPCCVVLHVPIVLDWGRRCCKRTPPPPPKKKGGWQTRIRTDRRKSRSTCRSWPSETSTLMSGSGMLRTPPFHRTLRSAQPQQSQPFSQRLPQPSQPSLSRPPTCQRQRHRQLSLALQARR